MRDGTSELSHLTTSHWLDLNGNHSVEVWDTGGSRQTWKQASKVYLLSSTFSPGLPSTFPPPEILSWGENSLDCVAPLSSHQTECLQNTLDSPMLSKITATTERRTHPKVSLCTTPLS
ncbi:hypothetical protein LEMLEM_LOCUS2789 [Lemmus lemmus]